MSNEASLAVRPGRPLQFSEEERKRILFKAAEDVFLEKGYDFATMNDIAQRAGMSKKTLYQVFTSKAALFSALLHERWTILAAPATGASDDPEEALVEILTKICSFVLSPRQIAMTRVMVAEAQRSPDITWAMKQQCLDRGDSAVETWLEVQASCGRIKIEDPRQTADMLLGAVFCKKLFDLIFELVTQPKMAEIEQHVRAVVGYFFRGISVCASNKAHHIRHLDI